MDAIDFRHRSDIEEDISEEYEAFKKECVKQGAEYVWEHSFRINAWCCIKDFLFSDMLSDKMLNRLFGKTEGRCLARLVDAYVNADWCDIADYNDLKELVINYIELH